MFQNFLDAFVLVQGWLLDHVVQPPLLALREITPGHYARCHFAGELPAAGGAA